MRPALTEGVKKYHIPSQKLGSRTRNGSKGARKNLLSSGRHGGRDQARRGRREIGRVRGFWAFGVVVVVLWCWGCSVVVWWVWVGWWAVVVWWCWGWVGVVVWCWGCNSVVGSAAGAGVVVAVVVVWWWVWVGWW